MLGSLGSFARYNFGPVTIPTPGPNNGDVVTTKTLVVAGGGGGGGQVYGGGGGAGGFLEQDVDLTLGQSYSIQVGNGGYTQTVVASGVDNYPGVEGEDSSFAGITAIGGGRGGAALDRGTSALRATVGGSGGGATSDQSSGAAGTAGQGFAGGRGYKSVTVFRGGGGGGGAGGDGQGAQTDGTFGGHGGLAKKWIVDNLYYAGGGGGATRVDSTPTVEAGGRGGGFTTTLSAAIDSSQTTIPLTSTESMLVGFTLAVDYEVMLITSISASSVNVTRAYNGSTADSHGIDSVALVELGGRGNPRNPGTSENATPVVDHTGSGGGAHNNSASGGTDMRGAHGIVRVWLPYEYTYDASHLSNASNILASTIPHTYNATLGTLVSFTNTTDGFGTVDIGTATWTPVGGTS